jgi:hypothetical protein
MPFCLRFSSPLPHSAAAVYNAARTHGSLLMAWRRGLFVTKVAEDSGEQGHAAAPAGVSEPAGGNALWRCAFKAEQTLA